MSGDVTFHNNGEKEARQRDVLFEKAMDQFWKTYHTQDADLWRCVLSAILTYEAEKRAHNNRVYTESKIQETLEAYAKKSIP